MDDSKYIDALKDLKKVRDENKQKVEKIRNVDLEKKKKIIACIVNTEIVEKLINDNIIFDPRESSGKLVWIDSNGDQLSLVDAVKFLRDLLNS